VYIYGDLLGSELVGVSSLKIKVDNKMVYDLETGVPNRRTRRKERIDEFRRKALLHKASAAIERGRSIAVLELDPSPIIADLERVRIIDSDTKKDLDDCKSREERVGYLIDFLADQPASRVLRPYANSLKKHNPLLYALLDMDKSSPYTAHITEVNLNKISSLTDIPVEEEPEEKPSEYRRGSCPALYFGNVNLKGTPFENFSKDSNSSLEGLESE